MKKIILPALTFLCMLLLSGCAPETPLPAESVPVSTASGPVLLIEPVIRPAPTPEPFCPPEGTYTIAWLSDTQYYSRSFPETFSDMTEFLQENREKLRLGYAVHTGDLIHNFDESAQWETARNAMSALCDIPHGVLAGNHDVGSSRMDYRRFEESFGEAYTQNFPWYGGSYQGNRGHYDLITLGKTDYIFVYMGYGADADGVRWINEVFAAYPGRVGVLCLHEYLDSDVTLRKIGKTLEQEVVSRNPNLYLVLCGHRYAVDHRTAVFDDDGDGVPDRTVYEMISNYQAFGSRGGDGYLRLLQIDESAGEMRILAYSPTLNDYDMFDGTEQRESLSLPLPWVGSTHAA